jgi:hypothetical protein
MEQNRRTIREQALGLRKGGKVGFPIARRGVIRVITSELNLALMTSEDERRYSTYSSREDGKVYITRIN